MDPLKFVGSLLGLGLSKTLRDDIQKESLVSYENCPFEGRILYSFWGMFSHIIAIKALY